MNLINVKQIRNLDSRISNIANNFNNISFVELTGSEMSGKLIISGELNVDNICITENCENRLDLWKNNGSGNLTLNYPLQNLSNVSLEIGSENITTPNFYINTKSGNFNIGISQDNTFFIKGKSGIAINLNDFNSINFSNSGTQFNTDLYTKQNTKITDGFLYIDNISGKLDEIDLNEYVFANYTIIANSDSINNKYSYFSKYDIAWTNSFTYYGNYGTGVSINNYNFSSGISGVPINIKFSKNTGNYSILDIYLENNTFQNWRVYFISEKIKLQEIFSSSSSNSSSSSSSSISSSSSKSSSSSSSSSISSLSSSSSSRSSSSSSSKSSSSSSSKSSSSSSSSDTYPNLLSQDFNFGPCNLFEGYSPYEPVLHYSYNGHINGKPSWTGLYIPNPLGGTQSVFTGYSIKWVTGDWIISRTGVDKFTKTSASNSPVDLAGITNWTSVCELVQEIGNVIEDP